MTNQLSEKILKLKKEKKTLTIYNARQVGKVI